MRFVLTKQPKWRFAQNLIAKFVQFFWLFYDYSFFWKIEFFYSQQIVQKSFFDIWHIAILRSKNIYPKRRALYEKWDNIL